MGNGAGAYQGQTMSRRLIVRPEAEVELTEAFDWYEDRVPGLGSEFLLCVDAVFRAILRSPQQYPHAHRTVRRALTRRFPYEIFFVEDDERLVVLSVFHARRDPKSWQERV
jgi:plasmid stabilization system protein ParE